MRIGWDFDDVIFDLTPELLKFVNKKLGRSFAFEEHHSFFLEEVFKITQMEALLLVREFVTSPLHRQTPAVSGAKKAIGDLRHGYKHFIITGRSHDQEPMTHEWIGDQFPQTFEEILFTNLFSQEYAHKKISKAELCVQLKLDYFVEDAHLHTEAIAKTKTHVLLFDRPWNRGVSHGNMTRVHTLEDIPGILRGR